jgi:uncharacterized protein (DUF1501 family)
LRVRELDKKQQTKLSKERVPVVPLTNPIRLVSLNDKIQLLQAGAVGDKYIARELEIWIANPNGDVVSHKQTVMFDATSERQEDRRHNVIIMLNGSGFDRNISYKLMMRDITQPNRPIDLEPVSVTIDLAIQDEFDLF